MMSTPGWARSSPGSLHGSFPFGTFFRPPLLYVMYLSDFFVYNYHYAILHIIMLVYVLALLLPCYLNCQHIIFITSFYTFQIK